MLFNKIKKDRIAALKAKEEVKKNLLGVLIGDCSKESKEPDDAKVISTIKKFIKNTEETYNVIVEKEAGNLDDLAKLKLEIDILEAYLPKQLSEEGIRIAILAAKNLGNTDIKTIMAFFKENYAGRYDGGLVSKLVKESL